MKTQAQVLLSSKKKIQQGNMIDSVNMPGSILETGQ